MVLKVLDLYTTTSLSHSGTQDTGKGVGLSHTASPVLGTYKQDANPPTGIGPYSSGGPSWNIADCFVHNNKLYLLYRGIGGPGKGIYCYDLNVTGDQITATYNSFVAISSMLAGATDWTYNYGGACQYDAGKVVLIGHTPSGDGNTPVVGLWDCTNWPWSAANADWLSPVAQGMSFLVGEISRQGTLYMGSSNIYIASVNRGQLHTLSRSTGAVLGTWQAGLFSSVPTYHFKLMGELGGQPVGGSRNIDTNISTWDISDLNNWTLDTVLLPDAGGATAIFTPVTTYKRATRAVHPISTYHFAISRHELSLLGFPATTVGWWIAHLNGHYGPTGFQTYDASLGEYSERILVMNSYRRSIGNSTISSNLRRFFEIDNQPWFITISMADLDMETEDPGGWEYEHFGLRATPIGPGTVTFSWAATESGTPRKIFFELSADANDYLWSTHSSKLRVRYRINAGAWSDWRCGKQEISNLDTLVNGKSAWGNFNDGDDLDVELQMCSGWPYTFDESVTGNPGLVGDPVTPKVCSADVSEPREVRPALFYEPTELGGGLG